MTKKFLVSSSLIFVSCALAVFFYFTMAVFSLAAHATELFETHINARAMGMGGAYSAVVSDEESLWYNPAGIAKNNGVHWTIIDPYVGISDPSALTDYKNLTGSGTFQTALNNLYGDPIWAGGGAKTAVIVPFFAFAYFYDIDAGIDIENPVNPVMNVNFVTDQGYAIGTGWSIAEVLQMGFAARYITRTGVRQPFGASTIAEIAQGTSSPSVIFDQVSATKGYGYALDYGTNLVVPGPVSPTFAFTWTNIGNTKFTPITVGGAQPPSEIQSMNLGASLKVSVPLVDIIPSIELRHLQDPTIQMIEKLHMGVEVALPILTLRTGLYQGYFSYGFGVNLGLIQIDAASWGTELGGYPGQLESQRYMAQVTLKLGFDFLGGASSKGGKDKNGNSSSSSSSSSSHWKQKVRR